MLKELRIGTGKMTLFERASIEDLVGIEIPESKQVSKKDRASLRTLVNLLRKTANLHLDGVSSHTGLVL